MITPNTSWLTMEDYRLVNLNTSASVKVNLFLGPICCGDYTHTIIAIDYYNREVRLEDGSIWTIPFLDSNILNTWCVDEAVIIGINDGGYLSGSNPHILINVYTMNYAIANCIY